jgi:hypothetical protein
MEEFLKKQMEMLDNSIIATPSEQYLENFAKANGGSNDFLLMQFAKNYGYKVALQLVAEELLIDLDK